MARKFNGTSDVASVAINLSGSHSVTVAAWMFRPSAASSAKIIFEYGGSNGFDVVAGASTTTDQMRSYGPSSQWSDSYTIPSLNAWHHYVWVFNAGIGSYNSLFIDGVAQGLTSFGGHGQEIYNFANTNLTIAGRASSLFFPCSIAEFGLWGGFSKPPTPNTGQAYVNAMADGWPPTSALNDGISLYLPFLGDSPEPDYSGQRHVTTLTGTTVVKHPGVRSLLMQRGFGRQVWPL